MPTPYKAERAASHHELANVSQQTHNAGQEAPTVSAINNPVVVGQRQWQHFTRLEGLTIPTVA